MIRDALLIKDSIQSSSSSSSSSFPFSFAFYERIKAHTAHGFFFFNGKLLKGQRESKGKEEEKARHHCLFAITGLCQQFRSSSSSSSSSSFHLRRRTSSSHLTFGGRRDVLYHSRWRNCIQTRHRRNQNGAKVAKRVHYASHVFVICFFFKKKNTKKRIWEAKPVWGRFWAQPIFFFFFFSFTCSSSSVVVVVCCLRTWLECAPLVLITIIRTAGRTQVEEDEEDESRSGPLMEKKQLTNCPYKAVDSSTSLLLLLQQQQLLTPRVIKKGMKTTFLARTPENAFFFCFR